MNHVRAALRGLVTNVALLALAAAFVACTGCTSQRMSQVIAEDVEILRTFKNSQVIPPQVVRDAQAIAVLRETEGAAVVGASGGEGVLVRRLGDGWSPPLAIEVASGSIGLQLGGQTRDVVLIFNSGAAVDQMFATGAFVGRIEGVAGDAQGRTTPASPAPEVIPYVRTGGLYGGLSVNGLTFQPSKRLNRAAYGELWTAAPVLRGEVTPPAGSTALWTMLKRLEE